MDTAKFARLKQVVETHTRNKWTGVILPTEDVLALCRAYEAALASLAGHRQLDHAVTDDRPQARQ